MDNNVSSIKYEKDLIASLTAQQKELRESLEYARNIQKSIFPSHQKVNNILPESFVFFEPKEIVSGDFYWIRKIDNHILFAVGDCTGHGVPGAFMSILGIIFLNEITNHIPLLPPNRILNALRERIMKTLNQTGQDYEQKDGIDMVLVSYNEDNRVLQFAGANNPLCLIRNNQIEMLKGNKMPIGISGLDEESFINQKIEIQEQDCIYLFTDGYIDQFGGKNDKKFKMRRFRQLLLDIHKHDFSKQKNILKQNLQQWRNNQEQTDDILIMGIGF
ncbi:MAG: PP2C family protein-serine/threonine phosphatase [Bacteroidota bacterium]